MGVGDAAGALRIPTTGPDRFALRMFVDNPS